jgi:hypothetical protein
LYFESIRQYLLNIYHFVLPDAEFKLHKIVKKKDIIFNSFTKEKNEFSVWIYSETSEFFFIELWDELETVSINQKIKFKEFVFTVISINDNDKIYYS